MEPSLTNCSQSRLLHKLHFGQNMRKVGLNSIVLEFRLQPDYCFNQVFFVGKKCLINLA